MKKIRFAVIGLGQRGHSVLKSVMLNFDEIEVTAVCDLYQDRVDDAAELVKEKKGNTPFATTDYRAALAREDVDAVYVATAWETHIEVAIEGMRCGKAVAVEVGGAYSLEELDEMVKTQERTGAPFMFMENCCFHKDELLATALVRAGKLGDIVHCSGAYSHDLRSEITNGNIIRHYRLRNYINRNTENYPTHELGPIAKILNINRGNRMVSLVSVASKAMGLEQYVKDHPELIEKDPTLEGQRFNQGDIVHTVITCAGGETILLKLDTTLPRSYSREFTVRGTKGLYNQDLNTVFIDGDPEYWSNEDYVNKCFNNATKYEEYLHPYWRYLTEEQKASGHGGMDGFLWREFLDALIEGKEMPIDVYDAAAWMAVTALSERSIAQGGMPQSIPDYTNGKWILRKPKDVLDLSFVDKK